jgi:hypothetical protein
MAKKFLAMGTNYPGTSYQLAGCRNDALDLSEALTVRGYTGDLLLDERVTRAKLLDQMRELIDGAESGDHLFISFSGHGTWMPDQDGDEADRRDEAICPNDLRTAGVITDDQLYEVFSQAKRGVHLVFFSDSCHSGSIQRLAASLEPGGLEMPSRQVRFLPPAVWAGEDITAAIPWRAAAVAPSRGKPRRSALGLAACTDTEVAFDAWFGTRPNGAYTYAALQALKGLDENATYRGWQRAIRSLLPSVDYPQTPQLYGTSTQKRWSVLS